VIFLLNFASHLGLTSRSAFLTSYFIRPRVRNDIETIRTIHRKIEKLVDENKNEKSNIVYCTASSEIINNDILNKAFAPNFSRKFIAFCSDVDLRDGFNKNFFDAEIILTATPPQTHLVKGQKVVTELNALFYSENDFRKHYEKLDSFSLDKGVTATLWQKISPLTSQDIIMVKNIFEAIYPEYPGLFSERINEFLK